MQVIVTIRRASPTARPLSIYTAAVADFRLHPSSSEEQRAAEPVMREALSDFLGLELAPRRFTQEGGAWCEVDAADDAEQPSVLAELFARSTASKTGQQRKVMSDAYKMLWLSQQFAPQPRCLLVFQDEAVAREFAPGSRTWRSAALAATGVEVVVVAIDEATRDAVNAAQVRQYR